MKKVCFFGEQEGSKIPRVARELERIVLAMTRSEHDISIEVGSRNAFDRLVIRTVRRCQEQTGCDNLLLTVSVPDMEQQWEVSRTREDGLMLELQECSLLDAAQSTPAQQAIELLWDADTAVCFVRREGSWAWQAMKHAERNEMEVIRIQ